MELREAIMGIILKNLDRRTDLLATLNHSDPSLSHGKKGGHVLKQLIKLMAKAGVTDGTQPGLGKFWANKG